MPVTEVVTFSDGERLDVPGRPRAVQLVAGFWMIQVASRDEASEEELG